MCYTHKAFKTGMNCHELVLEKVHRAITFSQNAWLKPYIDRNTDLRKKQRMI